MKNKTESNTQKKSECYSCRPQDRPSDRLRRRDPARAVDVRVRGARGAGGGGREPIRVAQVLWGAVLVAGEAWGRAGDGDLGDGPWAGRDDGGRVCDAEFGDGQGVPRCWDCVCEEGGEEQALRPGERWEEENEKENEKEKETRRVSGTGSLSAEIGNTEFALWSVVLVLSS